MVRAENGTTDRAANRVMKSDCEKNPWRGRWLAVAIFVLLGIIGHRPAFAQDGLPTLDAIQTLLDQGQIDTALTQLDRRIAADRNDVLARFLKGLVLLQRGDNAAAREVYLEIARQFPRLPEAFNNLAAIYVAEGEYEKALQALRSARANAPDYPLVHINLGDLYLRLAADAYREAISLDDSERGAAEKLERLLTLLEPDG